MTHCSQQVRAESAREEEEVERREERGTWPPGAVLYSP